MFLLDTCTLFWLTSARERLTQRVLDTIGSAGGALFVSAIGGFEIGLKYRNRKPELSAPPDEWFPAVLATYGVQELPVTSRIAILTTHPSTPHRDPFERLIAATAQVHALTVLTPDPEIAGYREVRVLW